MKFLVLLFLVGLATAKVLPQDREEEEERSIADLWEKIKGTFSDIGIDLKKKYMLFGDWVKRTVKDGLDKGESEIENIKKMAKKFVDNAEHVSQDVAHEAKDFFEKHKEELGDLWDDVQTAVQIANTVRMFLPCG